MPYGMVQLMRKCLLLLAFCVTLGTIAAVEAQVQLRFLPAQGERGRLGEAQVLPMVKIGSRIMRLAPGAVIYDQNNRSIVQAHLPAGAEVLYTRNQNGDVQRIYILTDQEREQLARAGRR